MSQQPSPLPWFIQTPRGWMTEQHDGYVSMVAPARDAELRVTTVDLAKPHLGADKWLAGAAHANRRLGRTLTVSEVGPFTGFAMDLVALGNRIRGWFLRTGELALVITYRSAESVGTRDDQVVGTALETLTLAGAAV